MHDLVELFRQAAGYEVLALNIYSGCILYQRYPRVLHWLSLVGTDGPTLES
jgi:hypothetical protein